MKILLSVLIATFLPNTSASATELRDTEFMKLGRHAAPWVPRFMEVLRANRPPRWIAHELAVFEGARGQRYLAVLWQGDEGVIRTPVLEFHKLIHVSKGREKLAFVRKLGGFGRSVHLEPPSGLRVFPNEAPVAVVGVWNGGLGPSNFGKRLVQMKRNTVDITPPYRVEDVIDIDGDGAYEVIVADDRWLWYFDERSGAGPFLQLVLERKSEQFRPAFRRYAEYYKKRRATTVDRSWIPEFVDGIPEPARSARSNAIEAEVMAETLLALAQIGMFDEARNVYRKMAAHYAAKENIGGAPAKVVLTDFGNALARAETLGQSACPASATESEGGNYGLTDRAERFRMDAPGPQ